MVYLPTKLGDFVRANVGKYSSTMEHVGMEIINGHFMVFWMFTRGINSNDLHHLTPPEDGLHGDPRAWKDPTIP